MSESFSILDCMLAPIFLRLNSMGVHLPKQQCRPIYLYCQRIFSRPAFLKVFNFAGEKTIINLNLNSRREHYV